MLAADTVSRLCVLPEAPESSFPQDVPNRENATRLGKIGLLLDTADSLLEDGRHLGRGCLGVGGVGAGLYRGSVESCGCGISGLQGKKKTQVSRNPANVVLPPPNVESSPTSSTELQNLARRLQNMPKSSIEPRDGPLDGSEAVAGLSRWD